MTKQDHIIILLDGEASAEPWVLDFAKSAYVIAADGGIRHATRLSVEPDLWVGDFDSSNAQIRERYKHVPQEQYPSDKAKSDGEIATDAALMLSPQKIVLFGALGGRRTDHGFFNALSALRYAHNHLETEFVLTGAGEIAMPLRPNKPLTIAQSSGATLSIVPFSALSGLSIDGVRWPLEKVKVELGSTHTLSNRIVTDAVIQLADGLAIAIVQTND